jgi:protein-disulfide isomerase
MPRSLVATPRPIGRRSPIPRRPFLAAALAALLVTAALIAVSAVGGRAGGPSPPPAAAADPLGSLAGIAQQGARLGPADAPVRITEWGDLQCPFCAEAARTLDPGILRRWVRPGTANLTFRTLAFIGPDSLTGALGAQAAALQNRLWPLVESLYARQGAENSGWLTQGAVLAAAAGVPGLDRAALRRDMGSARAQAALGRDRAAADMQGVHSTPHFLIAGPRGHRALEGVVPLSAVAAAIRAVR